MIKQNKKMIILTSIVTLLPIVIGLLLWNQLPQLMATHFNFNGQPNGYSSKTFTVFVLPLILLVIHLFCVIGTSIDPKSKNINKKIFSIVLWISPLISLLVCSCIYGYALGYITNISFLTELMIGVLFIVLGNYIPTVKPNYTVGIRTSWALDDPDNWYHTHRFGGKCMVIGGILLIVLSPFTMLIQYINSVSTMSPELQLAVAHGIFNIVTTILFFPFINKIVVIIKKIIPNHFVGHTA